MYAPPHFVCPFFGLPMAEKESRERSLFLGVILYCFFLYCLAKKLWLPQNDRATWEDKIVGVCHGAIGESELGKSEKEREGGVTPIVCRKISHTRRRHVLNRQCVRVHGQSSLAWLLRKLFVACST